MAGYDAVAVSYAEQLADEFDRKPFDRWLLGRIAKLAAGAPVADVGCGPGHGTALLTACGADVVGIDVSAGMVDVARHRYPDLRFQQGDLTRLLRPLSARAWGAVTCPGRIAPPACPAASSTSTDQPASASRLAATRPLWPAPITIASTCTSSFYPRAGG